MTLHIVANTDDGLGYRWNGEFCMIVPEVLVVMVVMVVMLVMVVTRDPPLVSVISLQFFASCV